MQLTFRVAQVYLLVCPEAGRIREIGAELGLGPNFASALILACLGACKVAVNDRFLATFQRSITSRCTARSH
jgi:hypothetical protein